MGPRPYLSFCACKTTRFAPELEVSVGPRPHLSFCASKTVCLASEILVSTGPSPHLRLLGAKRRLLDQNNKSLWVPAVTWGFWTQNSDFWTRITSLYRYQTSPVVLCLFNCVLSIRTSLYGSPPSSVDFECKTASFGTELYVSMGPRPHHLLYGCKTT